MCEFLFLQNLRVIDFEQNLSRRLASAQFCFIKMPPVLLLLWES